MSRRFDTAGTSRLAVLIVLVLTLLPVPTAAQGTITGSLPEGPPADVAFRLGPLQFWPALNLPELGYDTNVFDEPRDPKEDWTITFSPDLTVWAETGYLTFSGRSSADFTYFTKYPSERSIARQLRGRFDGRLSLLRPWVAAGLVETASRPTPEIDLRARRNETELSAGIGFDISPLSRAFASVTKQRTRFDDGEIFRGVDLRDALDRDTEMIAAGLRMQVTPFTTMTIKAQQERDIFDRSTGRNNKSRSGLADFTFGTEAVITGRASVGFRDLQPEDPKVEGFRGIVSSAGLTARFRMARFGIEMDRRLQYAFEESEAYYVQTGAEVTYTQRVSGPWDFQVRGGTIALHYGQTVESVARTDRVKIYGAGVGYNLRGRSRIGVNFEHSERDSSELTDRTYLRRRVYGSLTQNF